MNCEACIKFENSREFSVILYYRYSSGVANALNAARTTISPPLTTLFQSASGSVWYSSKNGALIIQKPMSMLITLGQTIVTPARVVRTLDSSVISTPAIDVLSSALKLPVKPNRRGGNDHP